MKQEILITVDSLGNSTSILIKNHHMPVGHCHTSFLILPQLYSNVPRIRHYKSDKKKVCFFFDKNRRKYFWAKVFPVRLFQETQSKLATRLSNKIKNNVR